MTKRIWLIGGTQESSIVSKAIEQKNLPCLISVTTESAVALYPIAPSIEVIVAKFSPEQLPTFLTSNQISAILDCSHPFAVEISRSAIAAASALQIPYLRFERSAIRSSASSVTQSAATFEQLLCQDWLLNQRVLLTIGYRYLPHFQPWHSKATLFARILPSQIALETALNSGFTSDRIIALRPPITPELERALWQQWQITTVVTKASGTPGGEDIKRQLADDLGIQLIVIERPMLEYPQLTSNVAEALEFCHQILTLPDSHNIPIT